jgi:hypothetical protein
VSLKILCLRCHTLLATAKPSDSGPYFNNRCRWERVTPPTGPEPRMKWWCPNPDCRRPRTLRDARVAATLDLMAREGRRVEAI